MDREENPCIGRPFRNMQNLSTALSTMHSHGIDDGIHLLGPDADFHIRYKHLPMIG